ncbi:MAG: sulfatase-like hydrolase/transferase [Planctomycetes bacterium]|nr:sulfatase-like hydrolase/transferase [Planctomycetota bacterium]
MTQRPNILFLMSDQHNASCMGAAGHPNVRTPSLDKVAQEGVLFTSAFANNPICSPSRICFMTGQYCHTHRILGNNNFENDDTNPHTLGAQLRRYGYQTALIGKAHMIKKWDEEAFEHIRYCDLADTERVNPLSNHYYKYLVDHGLADQYEDGTLPKEHPYHKQRYATAQLPYEHSLEHWTGEETIQFLEQRDARRPFFIHMSFERPHPNWMPAAEHVNLYNPEELVLPDNAFDWFENEFSGHCELIRTRARNRAKSETELKKILAHHFALVTVIDMEIGRVLDWLREHGEYENTVVVYTADHGDFAGDHGIYDKNMGIFESIHRIPFILKYPGSPQGRTCDEIIESVDVYRTLCDLAEAPTPECVEGRSLLPIATGEEPGRDFAICEWDFPPPQSRVNAIRTKRYRLVYYSHETGGELYDHETDPGETKDLWDAPAMRDVRLELMERLFDQINHYSLKSDYNLDAKKVKRDRFTPSYLVHKKAKKWSELERLIS